MMQGWGWLLVAYFCVINVATFIVYAYDKAIAGRSGRRRILEATLHTFALLGGTPAALLAMRALRHKIAKRPFRVRVMVIFFLQIVVVVIWALWQR